MHGGVWGGGGGGGWGEGKEEACLQKVDAVATLHIPQGRLKKNKPYKP